MAVLSVKKAKLIIISAVGIVAFSLASAVSGTIAWFNANNTLTTTAGEFSVVSNGAATVNEYKLIKFDYGVTNYGSIETIDYLTPETGTVSVYDFNYDGGWFGVRNGDVWSHRVNAMNIYDPTDSVIRRTSLIDLNCNAVYEVSFTAVDIENSYLQVYSQTFDIPAGELGDAKLLSDYVDIDVFYQSDLADDNPIFINEDDVGTALENEYNDKLYYPSYKTSTWNRYYRWNGSSWVITTEEPTGEGLTDRGNVIYTDYLPESPTTGDYYKVLKVTTVHDEQYYRWNGSSWVKSQSHPIGEGYTDCGFLYFDYDLPNNPSTGDYYKVGKDLAPLTENEILYYKISYLASKKATHSHFYGSPKSNRIQIVQDKVVDFSIDPEPVFYINVNYAPSRADSLMNAIAISKIDVNYDYTFEFNFNKSPIGGGS